MRVLGQPSLTSQALLRCAVFAGILSVIAGILGMHVMTGSHASHSVVAHSAVSHAAAAAAGESAAGHAAAADDGGGQPGGPAHPGGDAVVVLSAGAVCGEACPGAEEAGAACVPLANAGSFPAIPPPAPAMKQESRTAAAAAAYSYIPSSPTPCELSISRT
ncbi:hypothetical protein ACIQCM_06260 [Pseudarthrobacter sp. NPDC092439]|uniref:hypothetical protein n=1 Tax=unclassified Pseudarthrobacter TaxID=2647000 RepID=UPI003811E1AD